MKKYTVYAIRNFMNHKVYVGMTSRTLLDRWQTHKSEAKTRAKSVLHVAMRMDGADRFTIAPLFVTNDKGVARAQEEEWTRDFNSTDPRYGYNVSIGYKLQPASRAKMSQARTGLVPSDAHRAAVSRGNKGKPKSPEHCAALKAARRRYLQSIQSNSGADGTA